MATRSFSPMRFAAITVSAISVACSTGAVAPPPGPDLTGTGGSAAGTGGTAGHHDRIAAQHRALASDHVDGDHPIQVIAAAGEERRRGERGAEGEIPHRR